MPVYRKLDKLLPHVREATQKFISLLEQEQIRYVILETWRDQKVQGAYYAQGRESLERINELRKIAELPPITLDEARRVITHVRKSLHTEGKAVDIALLNPNGSIKWTIRNAEDAALVTHFGELGKLAGFEWGGDKHWTPLDKWGIGWDPYHFQIK